MKVAIVHMRLVHRGGLERRLFSYTEWFRARGDEVCIIVTKANADIELPEGVELVVLPTKKWPKPLRQWAFDRKLKRFMKKRSFDFSVSLGRSSSQDAVLAPGTHLGFMKALGLRPTRLRDRMETRMDRKAYRHTPLILAASEMMREEVIKLYGIEATKVKVLYPPIDTQRYHRGIKEERRMELRIKYDFTPGYKIFLFLSTGHGRKGLPLLLKVFERLKNKPYELWVAGFPAPKTNLPNVHYLGFIEETEELYAAADFTIHPALYEPYGQVVAESVLCGTPVLVSEMCGAKEILSATSGEVVKGYDAADWRRAIDDAVLRDWDAGSEEGLAESLSIDAHMRKMLELAGKA